MELHFTMSGRCLLDVCVCFLQMFAPLLEGGALRNDHVLLRDSRGTFRKYALRLGMLMADIPEICRQLGM
jgi:hypothetical protein